jgi:hypothetical protein
MVSEPAISCAITLGLDWLCNIVNSSKNGVNSGRADA